MEMDRQTIIVLFGAIIALTLFGTAYLASPARDAARPVFAEDDVRYKLDQQAEKEKKKRKGKKTVPTVTDSSSSGGDAGDDAAEEPPAEEPSAEEPSIE